MRILTPWIYAGLLSLLVPLVAWAELPTKFSWVEPPRDAGGKPRAALKHTQLFYELVVKQGNRINWRLCATVPATSPAGGQQVEAVCNIPPEQLTSRIIAVQYTVNASNTDGQTSGFHEPLEFPVGPPEPPTVLEPPATPTGLQAITIEGDANIEVHGNVTIHERDD